MIPRQPITLTHIIAPIVVASLFIVIMSRLNDRMRQRVSALLIAGAGAVYFGGGFGWWEVAFCALFTFFAYRGLDSYRYIGMAWVLHVGWDILHHLYGHSILPMVPLSSAGCAICDSVIALWYFLGARPLLVRRSSPLPIPLVTR